ncbi:MAG: hypothetical protein ACR2P7_04990 [bacterium]
MRRSLSWLEKSEETENAHEKFIFLWIAFNSAYGTDDIGADAAGERIPEAKRFEKFLQDVLDRDKENEIRDILWTTFSGPIRLLLINQYVFGPFWDFVRGLKSEQEWMNRFRIYDRRVKKALKSGNTHAVLVEIFNRLYTLRNQVFHGGTTFEKGWGKTQLRDGSRIMASLVPVILTIMQSEIDASPASEVWGNVSYPRINKMPDESVVRFFGR